MAQRAKLRIVGRPLREQVGAAMLQWEAGA